MGSRNSGEKSEISIAQPYTEKVWMFDYQDIMGPGCSFGQTNLTAAKPSLVTYYCLDNCVVGSISKDQY
jgi:hypothetical protein